MPENKYLSFEVHNRIAYITLDRPEQNNAIHDGLIIELMQTLTLAEQTPDVKVIVLKANGPVFCTGLDMDFMKILQTRTPEDNLQVSHHLAQILLIIYRSTKVYIAQIEGNATAMGAGLMTACDFAFVVPGAMIGYPEVQSGFVPASSMAFLLRKIGETRAKELMLSGDLITGDQAVRYNLVNRAIPEDEIKGYVSEFAERITRQNSQGSMQLTKKMIADIQDFPLENAVHFAAKMSAHTRRTPDFQRGINAFFNEEKISW